MLERPNIPSLDGAVEWLNSEPLDPAELRGHVVLVNFWTLTCINWLRQAPFVRAWSREYGADGLIVIGVHTPEFQFEHDIDAVRRATEVRSIDYPVAVDNDYAIWNAFANHYWPALYLVDPDGMIRDRHFGEGRYEQTERLIQRLLGITRGPVTVAGRGVEAAADWAHLETPETYLGAERAGNFTAGAGDYQAPARLELNQWTLTGAWTIEPDKVRVDGAGGSLTCRYHARDVNLVLARRTEQPIPFSVRVDGEPPGEAHGEDLTADGDGVLDDCRLYQLVRSPGGVRHRTIDVTFTEPGAEAYSFTFG